MYDLKELQDAIWKYKIFHDDIPKDLMKILDSIDYLCYYYHNRG